MRNKITTKKKKTEEHKAKKQLNLSDTFFFSVHIVR